VCEEKTGGVYKMVSIPGTLPIVPGMNEENGKYAFLFEGGGVVLFDEKRTKNRNQERESNIVYYY
jgi:hypothetical protein